MSWTLTEQKLFAALRRRYIARGGRFGSVPPVEHRDLGEGRPGVMRVGLGELEIHDREAPASGAAGGVVRRRWPQGGLRIGETESARADLVVELVPRRMSTVALVKQTEIEVRPLCFYCGCDFSNLAPEPHDERCYFGVPERVLGEELSERLMKLGQPEALTLTVDQAARIGDALSRLREADLGFVLMVLERWERS